jgi:hypothetical protein
MNEAAKEVDLPPVAAKSTLRAWEEPIDFSSDNKWVSVEDRLPKNNCYELYITCTERGNVREMAYSSILKKWFFIISENHYNDSDEFRFRSNELEKGNKVIYWMNMPQPPFPRH